MQTILLLKSAFLCVSRFFGLSSFDTVTTLILSRLASFLPFFEVIPEIFYNLERYEGYSRGSKNELLRILNDNPNFFGIWLPYSLIGHSEKAKHIIDTMLNHNLSEHIIAHRLIKTGLKEGVDWEWIFEENEWRINIKHTDNASAKYWQQRNERDMRDSKEYIKSSNPYEIDWEEQAEIECRGNIEW